MPTSRLRVLVIGRRVPLPDEYETVLVDQPKSVLSSIARFDPDVIVTTGLRPQALNTASFDLRRRWIDVGQSPEPNALIAAIESCYRFNLWSRRENAIHNPLVSVFTPSFETGDLLQATYESVRDQSYPTWEWVVVDDCSGDRTWDRLQSIAAEDARVRPFRSGRRIRRIGAMKDMATKLCRGDYLVELDHDDMLTEHALDRVKAAFTRNPDAGMVYSNCASFYENGSPQQYGDSFWKDRYRTTEYRGKKYLECINPDIYGRFGLGHQNLFAWFLTVGPNHLRAFRAATFRALGGYNPSLPVADDWDLYVRFFLESKCVHVDEMLYLYRFLDGWSNTTFTRNKSIQDHLALGRNHYAIRFEAYDLSTSRSKGKDDRPCFVFASRTEDDAARMRSRLADQDVFAVVGAASILQAYEDGRAHFSGRRRIIYLHDDCEILDLPAFLKTVESLPAGLHGVCGSAAPDALVSSVPWWDKRPLVGLVRQRMGGEERDLDFGTTHGAVDATWLDGLCLVTIGQEWSWKVPGDPPVWHGYDWLACRRTADANGRIMTIHQSDGPMLTHAGHGRTAGLEEAMRLLRTLTRGAQDRRDWSNVHEHLPRLAAEAHGTVVELGSRDGASTTALLEGVCARGGTVWSVDCDAEWSEVWLGHPRWRFVLGDSAKPDLLAEAGMLLPVDVLFIDSDHTYEQTKAELGAWLPKMRPGGTVLLHDTESFPEVKRAMLEAAEAHGLRHELLTNCNGLGILHIPGDCTDLSFVVLDATGSDMAERCLRSIREHAIGAEIVLVANGVEPSAGAAALADHLVHIEVNVGFAAGSNAGAAAATRKVLCFLNDDATFVDDATPRRLAEEGRRRIAAPYSNRAKPPQGDVERDDVPEHDAAVEAVVGLCMAMPSILFRDLGGFDTRLSTWEDDDLCLRARSSGFECLLLGRAWVDHERHATFRALGIDVGRVMAENGETFRRMHPKLRIVAIAKDEETAIPGFFGQFFPIAKDFCLLDTGSTDHTVEVARLAGAKVESAPFVDFAQARNEALTRFGDCDWILMLDPDERLDPATILALPELLFSAGSDYDVFLAPLAAAYPDGSRRHFVSKPFLFRSTSDLRWTFAVHEKLIGSVRQALVSNAEIEHVISLHGAERRAGAEAMYARLAASEPYFTDPIYRQKMRDEWPILDYDRPSDQRIRQLVAGPLVTAVIPTHRRPQLLVKAIASALAQDWVCLECVVVGDACPDMAAVIGSLPPAMARRVRSLNLTANHGSGGAVPRNIAIAMAAGSLIAYLDDDNEWLPGHVSSVHAAMAEAGASFGFSSMSVGGIDMGFRHPAPMGIDTSCIVHRRDLIAKHGPWKDHAESGYAHDWEIVSRWLVAGEKWAATGKPTLLYNAETSGQRAFIKAAAEARLARL